MSFKEIRNKKIRKKWLSSFANDLKKLKSKNIVSNIHPLGALTKGSNSLELAELRDMKESGAIGFYDYKKTIHQSEYDFIHNLKYEKNIHTRSNR